MEIKEKVENIKRRNFLKKVGVIIIGAGMLALPILPRINALPVILRDASTDVLEANSLGILVNGNISSNQGYFTGYVAKTANYTITTLDSTIDCTSGTFTVTLPTAVGVTGRIYNIKNTGTGTITVEGNGSEKIDGGLTAVLSNRYESIKLQSNGSNWIII